MRYDGHQAGEAADADAVEKELLRGGTGRADRAAVSSSRLRGRVEGGWERTWRWLAWGWAGEARASLRGRRLFTLFAVVNLINYLDRGVS